MLPYDISYQFGCLILTFKEVGGGGVHGEIVGDMEKRGRRKEQELSLDSPVINIGWKQIAEFEGEVFIRGGSRRNYRWIYMILVARGQSW